jgi:hypothetical protein
MTRSSTQSVILYSAVLAVLLTTLGCDTFADDQRQVIARDAQWTITAVGDLEASGRGFLANFVRFEAARLGVRYADGDLYEAGPRDHSFAFRYDSREWVARNALRLAHVPPPHLPTVELLVRNESSRTIKYLVVNTDELFLLLELPPGAFVTLPTRRWGDFTAISLRGVFDSGASFHASSEVLKGAAQRVDVIVRSERVDMNEAR